MRVYLVQHGDALPKDVDPQRPLSGRGHGDVEKVAALLGQAGVRVGTVLHSGKRRAAQTAERLAQAIGEGARIEAVSGINPLDSTEDFARTVDEWTADMMVVGHQPFMGKLTSRLVVGDDTASTVAFRPGSVVCLEYSNETGWSVAWMIRPELR